MCKTKERQHKYDIAYMKMAQNMADLSYAIKKQVGAIIVSEADQVISQGFNGTPTGCNNCCEDILPDGRLVTKVEVFHAESNAILKCSKYLNSTKNATLYVTLSPCIHCAKLIAQAEIKRVVYLEEYKDLSGINFLKECGITVEKLQMSFTDTDRNKWFVNDDGSKWMFCTCDRFDDYFYVANMENTFISNTNVPANSGMTSNMFHHCTSEEYNKKYRKLKNNSDKQ